jgi:6-phosphogluconolactonase (cycloisomerase 2 family)
MAGMAIGPRHLDFHPTEPWMYVSIETQNQIHMHRMQGWQAAAGGRVQQDHAAGTHKHPLAPGASTVHVHPNGRVLYGANRSQDVVDFNWEERLQGRREQHRRVRHQPADR